MLTSSRTSALLLLSLGAGLGVTAFCVWLYKRLARCPRHSIPTKWQRVGTLEQIFLFPIKSCAPMQVPSDQVFDCDVLGLRVQSFRDRTLMLVDEYNNMVSARTYPKMLLIQIRMIDPTKLLLTAENVPELSLDLEMFAEKAENGTASFIKATVWASPVWVMLCGEIYDKWFSTYLLESTTGLRLVYYAYEEPTKLIAPRMLKEPNIIKEDAGALSDTTSYNLLSMSSIANLEEHLEQPINPLQFRANFYLNPDIDMPFAEDDWNWLKIGEDAVFQNVAPCTRCILTNINVDTAERNAEGQPLKTLKEYRLKDNQSSPAYGIHLGLRCAGNIKTNDVVYLGVS